MQPQLDTKYMETLDIKAVDESGTVEGWVTTFGPPADRVGDVVMKGAFGAEVFTRPLLFHHNTELVIGMAEFHPRAEGVFLKGKLAIDSKVQTLRERAMEAQELAKMGALAFSFGYKTTAGEPNEHGGEDIFKADTMEASLVPIPANPRALVTAAKAYMEKGVEYSPMTDLETKALELEHFLYSEIVS